MLTKTDIASIPYKGGEQVRVDMLGGRIQMNFGPPPSVLPLIQQGKVRALAVTTDTRYQGMPDVPTFKESGLPQIVDQLHRRIRGARRHARADPATSSTTAINETLRSPELIAAMAKLGFVPEPWTIAQYEAFLAEEVKIWPGILKADRREDAVTAIATRGATMRMLPFVAAALLLRARRARAAAQQYPDKPIKLIVPLVAGSPIVRRGRVVMAPLSARLGQQIVIDAPAGRRHHHRAEGRRRGAA